MMLEAAPLNVKPFGLNVTRIEVRFLSSHDGCPPGMERGIAWIGCYSPLLPPYSECGPDSVAETGACGCWGCCGWRFELRRIWSSAFDIVMSLMGRDCSWYREAISVREQREPSPHKLVSGRKSLKNTRFNDSHTHLIFVILVSISNCCSFQPRRQEEIYKTIIQSTSSSLPFFFFLRIIVLQSHSIFSAKASQFFSDACWLLPNSLATVTYHSSTRDNGSFVFSACTKFNTQSKQWHGEKHFIFLLFPLLIHEEQIKLLQFYNAAIRAMPAQWIEQSKFCLFFRRHHLPVLAW